MDKKKLMQKYMEETAEGGDSSSAKSTAAAEDPFFSSAWSDDSRKRKSENLSDSDDASSPVKKNKKFEYRPSAASAPAPASRPLAAPRSFDASVSAINDTINAFKAEADQAQGSVDASAKPGAAKRKTDGEDFASKMMKKMGYEQGKGLGKASQGIVKPIDESNQKGKLGLGFKVTNFEKRVESWDYEQDPASAKETPEWLVNDSKLTPSLEELMSWKELGDKKKILDDETHFCSLEVVTQVLQCKSIFDALQNREMMSARSRANPYESVGAAFFQNRAALKMANIDAVFDFMFTNPVDSSGVSKVKSNEPLYFCDVCAGPGGFSEYVLWRRKWRAKGFGMTLKNDNDFKIEDFVAGGAEYFEPFYGEHGVNGDGDVTKEENLLEFQRFVLNQTNQEGVHFFMADGGFSVEGNENIQEILSKQLYLCQFLCALSVLRIGGNFVCKLFDIFTPFSVGLVYLMYLCFDRICLHKPVTSRPANSERYIVCEGAGPLKDDVFRYMLAVNRALNKTFRNEKIKDDVVSIVPLSVLKEDEAFFNYIVTSNETFGKAQVFNLKKVQAFATNTNLYDMRQSGMIEECLKYWNIPQNIERQMFVGDFTPTRRNKSGKPWSKLKVKFKPLTAGAVFGNLNNHLMNLKIDVNSLAGQRILPCDATMFSETFKRCSIYDYRCTVASGSLVLLLGCGRSEVYECKLNNGLNGDVDYTYDEPKWQLLDTNRYGLELPMNTLVLAEKCIEYKGLESGQTQRNALHILDAYVIDGENVMLDSNYRVVSMEDRRPNLEIFIKAISKPSRSELCPLRLKDLFKVENIDAEVLQSLTPKIGKIKRPLKNMATQIPPSNEPSDHYVYPTAIYFFKQVEAPWSIAFSKNSQRFYYYNSKRNESSYVVPPNASIFASPKSYLQNGFVWIWKDQMNLFPDSEDKEANGHDAASSSLMTRDKLMETVKLFR